MTRLEKIARRQLRRAEAYRRSGDMDAAEFAAYWYRKTQRRISRTIDYAFLPRIDLTGVQA